MLRHDEHVGRRGQPVDEQDDVVRRLAEEAERGDAEQVARGDEVCGHLGVMDAVEREERDAALLGLGHDGSCCTERLTTKGGSMRRGRGRSPTGTGMRVARPLFVVTGAGEMSKSRCTLSTSSGWMVSVPELSSRIRRKPFPSSMDCPQKAQSRARSLWLRAT